MRILFVLGRYMPTPSANGVCVYRIQDALMKLGIASDVVVDKYSDTISESPYGKVYMTEVTDPKVAAKSFFKKIKAILNYPVYYPRDIQAYKDSIIKAVSENEYDAIISVLKPGNGALAATCFSNALIYELDSLTNNEDNEDGYKRFLKHRVRFIERVIYQKAAYIFHMHSHKHFYDKEVYRRYSQKSEYLDIPQLVNENIDDVADNNHEVVSILYSGILHREMRSPEYPIKLIKELNNHISCKLKLDFYSRGECESMIAKAEKETDGIIVQHGYVTLSELNNAVGRTNYLLSIGNNISGTVTSLPSKLISYMSYGKPIIHIDAGKNDIVKEYLKQYPLSLIIDPKADFAGNVKKLKNFMCQHLDSRVSFDEVRRCFPMNTPEYTVERMIEVIQHHCTGKVQLIRK